MAVQTGVRTPVRDVPKGMWLLIAAIVFIASASAFIAVMLLFGDNTAKTAPTTPSVAAPVTQAPTQTFLPSVNSQAPAVAVQPPARPANQVRIGSLIFTDVSARIIEDETPPEGKHLRYVAVHFSVKEVGDRGSRIDPSYFRLVDNEGVLYALARTPPRAYPEEFYTTNLSPGGITEGILYFTIPQGVPEHFSLRYQADASVRGTLPLTLTK